MNGFITSASEARIKVVSLKLITTKKYILELGR